jgi:hypothetical protein
MPTRPAGELPYGRLGTVEVGRPGRTWSGRRDSCPGPVWGRARSRGGRAEGRGPGSCLGGGRRRVRGRAGLRERHRAR